MKNRNKLKSFFTEHWKYLAVSTACKLNIFDAIGNQEKSAEQLASALNLNEHTISLLLNALYSIQFLSKSEKDYYSLNEDSMLLTETHPLSLKNACINWSEEHLDAWQNLDYAIKTGKSSFQNQYGVSYFNYLNENPRKLHNYHKAMNEYASDDYMNLPEIIDFSIHKSLMDVGGGYGAVINFIKNKHPEIDCYLFDLDKVIENAPIENVTKMKGNFFENIPFVADAIILSRVLHDWNDENANRILHNCCDALPQGGLLYIIENCSDMIKIDLSLLSLNMFVMCESFERTSSEYINIAKGNGFSFIKALDLNELQTILIFIKL